MQAHRHCFWSCFSAPGEQSSLLTSPANPHCFSQCCGPWTGKKPSSNFCSGFILFFFSSQFLLGKKNHMNIPLISSLNLDFGQ